MNKNTIKIETISLKKFSNLFELNTTSDVTWFH